MQGTAKVVPVFNEWRRGGIAPHTLFNLTIIQG